MGELNKKYRSLQVFLDSCVKCGACTVNVITIWAPPIRKICLLHVRLYRKVYRRYFTVSGKLFPKLVGAEDLTEEVLDDWYSYFHQCSQCRRCSVYCPYGN